MTSLFALTPYLSGNPRPEKNPVYVFLQQYKHHLSLASAACFPAGCGPQSHSGAFRDTVLYCKCSGSSAHPAEQGLPSTAFSSAPLQPVARARLCTLNPPVPAWGMVPPGASTTWLQPIPPHPPLQHSLTPLREEGKCGGMREGRATGSPAVRACVLQGNGKREGFLWILAPGCNQYNLDFKYFISVTLIS